MCLPDALQVIKDCQSTEFIMINEHGEVEMDRDMQTDFTLWKLHDFMEQSAKTVRCTIHCSALC